MRKGVAEVGEFLQDDGPNADNEPSALSDWLRDQEVVALARFARDARLVGVSFGRRLRQHGKPTGTLDEAITLGQWPEQGVPVSTGIDSEMLRVVARAVLLHNERLMAEGLSRSAVECAVFHARVLTTATCDTTGVDGTEARHGRALQQVLGTLTGPASTTLLIWLDEALGPRP